MDRGKVACALALAALMAPGAGCGSDDDVASESARLTTTQLRTQAEAICERANARIVGVDDGGGSRSDASAAARRAFGRALARTVTIRREALEQLERLEPPAALRRDYERYLSAIRDVAEGFPTVAETVAGRDPRAGERDAARRETAELAATLGLTTSCG